MSKYGEILLSSAPNEDCKSLTADRMFQRETWLQNRPKLTVIQLHVRLKQFFYMMRFNEFDCRLCIFRKCYKNQKQQKNGPYDYYHKLRRPSRGRTCHHCSAGNVAIGVYVVRDKTIGRSSCYQDLPLMRRADFLRCVDVIYHQRGVDQNDMQPTTTNNERRNADEEGGNDDVVWLWCGGINNILSHY